MHCHPIRLPTTYYLSSSLKAVIQLHVIKRINYSYVTIRTEKVFIRKRSKKGFFRSRTEEYLAGAVGLPGLFKQVPLGRGGRDHHAPLRDEARLDRTSSPRGSTSRGGSNAPADCSTAPPQRGDTVLSRSVCRAPSTSSKRAACASATTADNYHGMQNVT